MTSKKVKLNIKNANDTGKLANNLARALRKGEAITLTGELGTGKTTFARSFISSFFDGGKEVTSPTFNLLQIYSPVKSPEIWHFDLYRIKREEEIEELGMDEAFQEAITIIEWPDVIKHVLPEDRLDITILYKNKENERTIEILGYGRLSEELDKLL